MRGKLKYKIHPLFFLFGAAMAAAGNAYLFGIYTVTLIIHELAHALAARRLGFSPETIELMPYGAALSGTFKGVSVSDELKIAFAGPAVNLVIAGLLAALWWIVPESYNYTDVAAAANLTTGIFNLLPAYPLDGGRAALALLSLKFTYKKSLAAVKVAGVILAAALFGFYIISIFKDINFTFAIAAVFLMQGALFDIKDNLYNAALAGRYKSKHLKKGLPARTLYVSPDMTLQKLLTLLNHNYYHTVTVTDKDFKELFSIKESALAEITEKRGLYTKMGELYSPPIQPRNLGADGGYAFGEGEGF